jgi:hypothetical protein
MTTTNEAEQKEKKRKRLLIAALLSPFLMALLPLIPPISYLAAGLPEIENKNISMALKAMWFSGIGTTAIFLAPIREGKALFAMFYVIIATSVGLMMPYVYAAIVFIPLCLLKPCMI